MKKSSALRAIREFCLRICEPGPLAVKECDDRSCPLNPYRFGHRPCKPKASDSTLADRRRQIVAAARTVRQAKRNLMLGQGPGDQPILF